MEGELVQISRIYKLEGDSKTKAFVDVSLDGFVVKGLRIVEGKNGLFLSMPREKGKDGKWYSTFFPATAEKQKELNELVLAAYQEGQSSGC